MPPSSGSQTAWTAVCQRWLYVVSRAYPLGYVVDAERALAVGDYPSGVVLAGTAVAVDLVVACVGWGVHTFRHSEH